jgi:Phage phiEco32-like COOH.NH2 ligase-type 2
MAFRAVKELVGKDNVVVRLSSRENKPKGLSWDGHPAHKFGHDLILIKKVHPFIPVAVGAHGYVTIEYSPRTDKNSNPYLDPEFQVEEITDEKEIEAVKKEVQKEMIENLQFNLHHSFMIGSDPEIFVEKGDGSLFPAFEFLPPLKTPIKSSTNQNVYWDGFQAEFQTEAAGCLERHLGSVWSGLQTVLLQARLKDKNAKLSARNIMDIPPKLMEASKDEHVNFGCMPSFNVYGLKGQQIPPREIPFRPAGGHIHFGIGLQDPVKDKVRIENIVKALDKVLGVACVSLFQHYDSPARRQLYGLPGEYRLPPHGIEYRTLSNAWLTHPTIANLVVDLSRKVVMFGMNDFGKYWDATEDETIKCIINCDVKKAQEIITRNKTIFLKMYQAVYGTGPERVEGFYEGIFQTYMKGIGSLIEKPDDIVNNWNLDNLAKVRNLGNNQVRNCTPYFLDLGLNNPKAVKIA